MHFMTQRLCGLLIYLLISSPCRRLVNRWSLDTSIQSAASRKIVSSLNRMIHMHDLERTRGVLLSHRQLQDLRADAAAELLPLAVAAPLQLVARLVSDGVHHAGQLDLVLELMCAFRPILTSRPLCRVLFLQQQQKEWKQPVAISSLLSSAVINLPLGYDDTPLASTLRELLLGLPFPNLQMPRATWGKDTQNTFSNGGTSAHCGACFPSSQALTAAPPAPPAPPHHSPSDRTALLHLCRGLAEQGLLEKSQQVQYVVVPVLRAWLSGSPGLETQVSAITITARFEDFT
jgi:hypothetical protein